MLCNMLFFVVKCSPVNTQHYDNVKVRLRRRKTNTQRRSNTDATTSKLRSCSNHGKSSMLQNCLDVGQ